MAHRRLDLNRAPEDAYRSLCELASSTSCSDCKREDRSGEIDRIKTYAESDSGADHNHARGTDLAVCYRDGEVGVVKVSCEEEA